MLLVCWRFAQNFWLANVFDMGEFILHYYFQAEMQSLANLNAIWMDYFFSFLYTALAKFESFAQPIYEYAIAEIH